MARPRHSQGTRERLLGEGMRALRQQGYHGTGIKEVVDRVNVPKGSFYNYFDSKEHFGAEVIRLYGDHLLGAMDFAFQEADDNPLGALGRYYGGAIEAYQSEGPKEGCLLCNLGAELGGTSPLADAAIDAALKAQHRRLVAVLERGRELGQVRTDISAEELAYGLLDNWNGALIRMKSAQSVAALRQFRDLYLDHLLRR